jgi:hypothetical protein
MKELSLSSTVEDNLAVSTAEPASTALTAILGREISDLLDRMFRDPRVLEPHERRDLIGQLRTAVELEPRMPEIRVLLGMALCVDLQAQEALEQLRESVRQAPESFIARLKFGELLMRLRICNQASEETEKAAKLASNPVQSDLARRQAATIRTMLREGIERGGYGGTLSRLIPFRRKQNRMKTAMLAETR